ncbi:hypothetical protein B0H10DRAFT_1777466 [Mycena sp. CBHHK59/15]|nr:hypothetical protein B0H10DRAFT_1777466 [Mycena sp. CBHHK59/15]
MEADEDQKPVIANQDDDDDDDLEDHLIEIGPDGLRTVSDCVAAVFDPDEENPCALICAFCVHRHTTQGGESPDRFIGATIEGLAAHCMEEHETAWGLLRANVEE